MNVIDVWTPLAATSSVLGMSTWQSIRTEGMKGLEILDHKFKPFASLVFFPALSDNVPLTCLVDADVDNQYVAMLHDGHY
jgi:hypothetical protein